MADEVQFSSHKRKFDDPSTTSPAPTSATRRPTGFSAPISSENQPPSSYNSVPPPPDGIELAKQRAQEIAAKLFSDAEAKRPKTENGAGADASSDYSQKSFSQQLPSFAATSPAASFNPYGYTGSSKRIDIPNGRVGVIIGKGGETIKYLQQQSGGCKIQVTRDADADPYSQTRTVDLTGTSEQISKAEKLISDVLAEAESGGSGTGATRKFVGGQVGGEQFSMKVPNNKVGLIIGKGGETIKNMQASSGARIQIIPLHPPPGDTSTERTVQIDGTAEQIESAKQLVNEVISEMNIPRLLLDAPMEDYDCYAFHHTFATFPITFEPGRGSTSADVHETSAVNRVRNPQMGGGYSQQGYRPPRPPANWGPPGLPAQQPGYGYMQPGAYSGQPLQYNTSQPPYGNYPPQPASGGYASGWDQSSNISTQQSTSGTGYDYYSHQQQQQQQQQTQQQTLGTASATADNSSYNYGQPPQGSYSDTSYSQTATGQDPYSGSYNAQPPQPGASQPTANSQTGYDQGYGSAQGYSGTAANSAQDGSASTYGSSVGAAPTQQGYTGQPPSSVPTSYPSQAGYGQPAPVTQPSYGQSPQAQKQPVQAGYGQTLPPPPTQAYAQPGASQSAYGQPPPLQPGYGLPYGQQVPAYGGAPPPSQAGYGQQQQLYADAYGGGGFSHPPAYSSEGGTTPTVPGGVAKSSPRS